MFCLLKTILLVLLLLMAGCEVETYPEPAGAGQPEVLIYCGMTMIQPLMELRTLFEAQEKCRVKISYGGSGHITRSVLVNQIGDLFFPGKKMYINQLQKQGLVTDSVLLGHNVAGYFVQPGNPQRISPDLSVLLNPHLRVVIGSAEAGAIGKETKLILDDAGIYQSVLDNTLFLTTDSKGLIKAINDKEADIVVNWKAVCYWPENKKKMTFIPLEGIAYNRSLVMGLLSFSKEKDLAQKFMAFASSEKGRKIFQKYGF